MATSDIAVTTPPDLDDASKFVKYGSVPILDVHSRRLFDEATGQEKMTFLTPAQLAVVTANTNRRAEAGEIPQVFIGHTRKGMPETDQPPSCGWMRNFRVADHNGRPTMIADLFMKQECKFKKAGGDEVWTHAEIVDQFPRRSVEAYGKMEANGYIDALALLKRAPERDLGLVTYGRADDVELFECPDCEAEKMAADAPPPASDVDPEERAVDMIADRIVGKLMPQIRALFDEIAEHENNEEHLEASPAVGVPSDTSSYTPEPETMSKGNETPAITEADVRYAALQTQIDELKEINAGLVSKNQTLTERIEKFEKADVKADRRRRLEVLAKAGYPVNVDAKMKAFEENAGLDFEAFEKDVLDTWPKVKQAPTGEPIRLMQADEGVEQFARKPEGGFPDDPNFPSPNEIEQFARDHNITRGPKETNDAYVARLYRTIQADKKKATA